MRLEERVNKYYKELNQNDLLILAYINEHRKECENLPIEQLAKRCNVSRTTILRFSKKLSFKGYGELKVYLKLENVKVYHSYEAIDLIYEGYMEVMKSMKEKDCTAICKGIQQARRLYVYGVGMIQNSIKKEIKRIFLNAGKVFYDINGQAESKAVIRNMNKEDLVILISLSGESSYILEVAGELKVRNVPMISITKQKENRLAQMSNENLYIMAAKLEQSRHQIDYESASSFFILIEILFLKYLQITTGKGQEVSCETGRVD